MTREKRASEREKCWIKAAFAAKGEVVVEALLTDISETGARVQAIHPFAAGEEVELLGFRFSRPVTCQIVWVRHNEYGLKFCA